IFQTCKNYGLNHMRFHSWCPPEAAFEAADEMGFYLQPECGMWNSISPGSAMEKMLYLETDRIIKAYGNHPSFVMLSAMNEAHGNWKPSLAKWVEHFRALDPRRLYTPDTGWSAINEPGPVKDADYLSVGRIGPHRVRGESAWFGGDYSESLKGVDVPVLAHELGQWCAYPDFDVIKKFTGYLRPGNYEIFRDSAEAHGVLSQNKNFARASGEFQLECYKEEIEANLRTPGMAGFQLLDLHDYLGQGTALVGLLDTFWESKGYASPEEFRKSCNTVVPLARLKKRVFTTTDSFDVPVEIANFSQGALTNATVIWRILDRNGKGRAIGMSNGHNIPIGKNELEKISENFASLHLPASAQYKLQIYLQGTPFTNDWNFWLYPAEISDAAPTNVFITSSWADAEKKLSDGGNVLFLPRNSDLDWTSPPLARVPIFWNRLMNPGWSRMLGLWCDTNSPALAEFPTDENCDWQWTELLRNTRAINLDKLPRGLHPIVSAIDDWNRNYKLGVIFEAKVGSGKLLVCSIDLNDNSSPVARQLRRSLLDYMSGKNFKPKADAFDSVFGDKSADKFRPQTEISLADFESLHFDSRIMRELGATATGEGDVRNALDGDPNTYWIADGRGRNQSGTKHPHELTIRFPETVAMKGIVLMPRQNDRDHLGDVRGYKIEASDDGSQWREIASGELASTWSPQRVEFGKTISTRQLKFVALSGFGNDASAALAELAVMYAGPEPRKNASGEMEYRKSRSTSTDVDE
ncbi:MAG TPA: discoidin domain-containing protein, partial [Verrucomicrobiae bacterium]|nr:discoidin domain-containing protein [Verrucomicrobiae bacterium]